MELRLKELLKEKGVTTYQLAEHFGVTQPTISSRMNGNPDIKWLFRVAEHLNVDISELFSEKGTFTALIDNGGTLHRFDSIEALEGFIIDLKNK